MIENNKIGTDTPERKSLENTVERKSLENTVKTIKTQTARIEGKLRSNKEETDCKRTNFTNKVEQIMEDLNDISEILGYIEGQIDSI